MNINLKLMLKETVSVISRQRDYLNYINVFPVRDGDTGNNLYNTLKSSLSIKSRDTKKFLVKLKKTLLINAKGNSGVILSQFFKGFCDHLIKFDLNSKEFVKALKNGYESAYKSITEPREGTMLSVLKGAYIGASKSLSKADSITDVLLKSYDSAKQYLKRTVRQLPVLRKSGVVDAGGLGVFYMLGAWLKSIGIKPVLDDEFENLKVLEFDELLTKNYYCVNALITDSPYKDEMKTVLRELGDSLLIGRDTSIMRVHIHSSDPEAVRSVCESFGKVTKFTFDDMRRECERVKRKSNC